MRAQNGVKIKRSRTAIGRSDYSRPVRLALESGLLLPTTTVFDYGCGRGGLPENYVPAVMRVGG